MHNNNQQVIIDIPDVDHIDPNTFAIWNDFDGPGWVIRLRDNVFEQQPRTHTFSNCHAAGIESEIKPGVALMDIIKVIAGTDTLLAVTDHDDGDFKIRGIRSSTIKLMVIPSNGYRDAVINNIQLSPGRDTQLCDIRFSQ